MKINKIENAQNFKAIYKVKISPSDLKRFEENVAPIYRANKRSGIKGCFKKPSELFVLTEGDSYEFDKQYSQHKRNGLINNVHNEIMADNIIQLPENDNNFMSKFLFNKPVKTIDNFNGFLTQLFK